MLLETHSGSKERLVWDKIICLRFYVEETINKFDDICMFFLTLHAVSGNVGGATTLCLGFLSRSDDPTALRGGGVAGT